MNKRMRRFFSRSDRLLGRLLHWVPAREPVDWADSLAARWHEDRWGGRLVAHRQTDPLRLEDLLCIDRQRDALVTNTRQFLQGLPANNVLLWGARGTGKSSLVHGLLNRFAAEGLRLVEVDKYQLSHLASIAGALRGEPYRFLLFCDDLSFETEDSGYKVLKSALEGSVFAGTGNVLVYATSNRRHLLPEYASDNENTRVSNGELHESEAVEEKISLSDRFGLWLSFYPFKQGDYLTLAEHWVGSLARDAGAGELWDEQARAEALRWALARGVRSGRTAQHFARHWVGSRLIPG